MTDTTVVCPSCGAHNAASAEWCTQCYARLDTLPANIEDPRAEAAGDEEREFAHPDATVVYQGRPIYSRWRGGETSFGPVGRIVMTLLVIAVGVGLGFNYSPVPIVIWVFLAMPVLLRQIWKRVPIGYAEPELRILPPDPPEEKAS